MNTFGGVFIMVETRFCKECGKEFELTLEYFPPVRKNYSALRKICRACTKRIALENYYKNWETRRENNKKWIEDNKDKRKVYSKEYDKKYAEINKEKISAYQKEYDGAHHKELNEYSRKYYHLNAEKISDRNSENYKKLEVRSKHKIQVKNWNDKNKSKINIYTNNRRADKKQLIHSLTIEEWDKIKNDFRNKCAYCGKELPLTQEHFIALSKGGEYTVNNIVPACQSCNSSKNNKDFFIWFPKFRHYSKEREKKILEYLNYKNNNSQQLALL